MTITDTFYIGTALTENTYFKTLDVWFSGMAGTPVRPDWTFSPYSGYQELANAGRLGIGYPKASWNWQHRRNVDVEALRDLCPGLSASVFIRTPINEADGSTGLIIWKTFACMMLWMPDDEEKSVLNTLGFTIEFRRLVLQV